MIKIGLLLVLLATWLAIAVRSFEFYTTTIKNRFRFRYWFMLGVLNMAHILLALSMAYSGDQDLQPIRWSIFLMMDILLLEIFVTSIKRPLELGIRFLYYINLILDFNSVYGPTPLWLGINGLILMILARRSPYTKTYRYFTATFMLYIVAMVMPYIGGNSSELSFLAGAIYSIHLAYGVRKLYFEEKVIEHILQVDHTEIDGHRHLK